MSIGFVVLHYMDFEMTKKSINSILKLEGIENQNINIIVVDNASKNDSFFQLEENFKSNKIIHLIRNTENLGFAKGNNIGYNYAKNNLGLETIIVMNNDIIFEDKLFFVKLLNKQSEEIDIISPNILNLNNYKQSPIRSEKISSRKYCKLFINNIINYIVYSIPIINKKFDKLKQSRKKKNKSNSFDKENYSNLIVPHGAIVIFTKKWVESEEFAFYPKTFMYFEEDILHKYCLRNNKKIKFEEDLIVRHLEDVSTNMAYSSNILKKKFISKNMIKSMLIYLRV